MRQRWNLRPTFIGFTGVPCSKETISSYDPAVGLCLGPYGNPREWRFLMSEVPLYGVAGRMKRRATDPSRDLTLLCSGIGRIRGPRTEGFGVA